MSSFVNSILSWLHRATSSSSSPPPSISPASLSTSSNSPAETFPTYSSPYHPSTPHEVYHTAFLLCQVLVPDLVPPILELAEYWTRTTQERHEPRTYIETRFGPTPPDPYIIASLQGALPARNMVRMLRFEITSHDQGWSSFPQYHGTYEASCTWFEAEIREVAEKEGAGVMGDDGDRDGNSGGGQSTWRQAPLRSKELCRNVHAQRKDKTHVIVWRFDAEAEEQHGEGVEEERYGAGDDDDGGDTRKGVEDWAKDERQFVKDVGYSRNRVVAVVPHARYPGWRNFVEAIRIDIYTSWVRRL